VAHRQFAYKKAILKKYEQRAEHLPFMLTPQGRTFVDEENFVEKEILLAQCIKK
jgi:hypothetical protein